MNRRELLSLFGVGAIAVPIINGSPVVEATARMVEPARVEPIQFTPAVDNHAGLLRMMHKGERVAMVILTARDGDKVTIRPDWLHVDYETRVDSWMYDCHLTRYAPTLLPGEPLKFELAGRMYPPLRGLY